MFYFGQNYDHASSGDHVVSHHSDSELSRDSNDHELSEAVSHDNLFYFGQNYDHASSSGDDDESSVSHYSDDGKFYFGHHASSGIDESNDSELISLYNSSESQYSDDDCESHLSPHCDGLTSSPSSCNEFTAGQYQALYSGLNYRDFLVQRQTMDSQVPVHSSSLMNNEIRYLAETGHDRPLSSDSGSQFADMKALLTPSSITHINNLSSLPVCDVSSWCKPPLLVNLLEALLHNKGKSSNKERKRKRQQKQCVKKRKKELKGTYCRHNEFCL